MNNTKKNDFLSVEEAQFPVVGIGASAGGLEALEQFFSNMPENTGMAFVVIQHLDPTHKGIMPELLQRMTKMKVVQAIDRMKIKQNCMYVIPPNKSMSILKGSLHLFEPIESRGLRMPIDFFFRSLADDIKEKSIGIILSGMGSDGSEGLRAIKEKSGIVVVQDPATAKYDGMPRSALNSVIADIVAPAFELPAKLIALLSHPYFKKEDILEKKDKSSLDKIIILLRSQTGNDFSLYKKNTLYRRIERRMGVHQIDKIATYVRFLMENRNELNILFKELLIGVTGFLRDANVWDFLKTRVLPPLLNKMPNGYVLRAWVIGCSTGEEAYSLAIIFKEAMEQLKTPKNLSLQIFATDLDIDAIDKARKGIFSSNIASDVSTSILSKFFIQTEEGYRVNAEIREMIVFANQNVIKDPPFTKLDILLCRNLLIYMEQELQKKLIALFHFSLNPGGIMVLGSAETYNSQSELFTPLNPKLRLYSSTGNIPKTEFYDFPSSISNKQHNLTDNLINVKSMDNIQTYADQLILKNYAPASVLVNNKGDIIYITGHIGKFMEPAPGKANMNIFSMARDELRNELPMSFRKALHNYEPVFVKNMKSGANGQVCFYDALIQQIEKPDALKGLLIIVFTNLRPVESLKQSEKKQDKSNINNEHSALELELQHVKEELRSTREEMQTSLEELKSTNEELQSTNEELQSTNEELTTSKEEMQSLNEELQTVNAELQSKVEDYFKVNNDMQNLLNSIDIATLFLDKNLNIRRFTKQATSIFKMIHSDIGRPFTDLVSHLNYPELSDDAREVLRTLVFIQKSIPTSDGRWYNISIMPYRTTDDRIEGLVITFTDITKSKILEDELNKKIDRKYSK